MLAAELRGNNFGSFANGAQLRGKFQGSPDLTQLVPVTVPINYDNEASAFRTFLQNFGALEEKEGFEAGVMNPSGEFDDIAAGKALLIGSSSRVVTATGAVPGRYMLMLQEVADLQRTKITIELDDLFEYDTKNLDLIQRISKNAYHYIELFSRVIDEIMPESSHPIDMSNMDVIDVIVSHRKARQMEQAANEATNQVAALLSSDPLQSSIGGIGERNPTNASANANANTIPASLTRRYNLYLKPLTKNRTILSVRQIHSSQVGSLISLKGIITRISEVRPLLTVGTYTCEKCAYEIYQEVTTQSFMPLPECPSEECRRLQSKGQLYLQTRGSRFQKFQEGRIQELADQVPMGHIPRSMGVVLMGDLTRQVNPGDQVIISGIFMPKPYTGYKAIKAGLLTDTYLLAMDVQPIKLTYEAQRLAASQSSNSIATTVTSLPSEKALEEEAIFGELCNHSVHAYGILAKSIAPEIYGHEDIKKALLLLMVGGVTKEMSDGMRIRGDINICLMGDPGVAKSQLLKYITKLAPRTVYTTGKGSSGVGLTAAVTKDPVTNEMVLEGGALVLADNGICCIDEFDKMEESDRTAIHEVMEQQTISISKAGITTTLNARTSIIAAANPLHGRYNPKKSPRENINLPPALLSRFDLLFLLLDQPDREEDARLAQHICNVHRTYSRHNASSSNDEHGILSSSKLQSDPSEETDSLVIPPTVFRRYIAHAKQFSPIVPSSLIDYIVGSYVGLRENDLKGRPDTTYTTPRTLLAILRLSQALARLRFSDVVNQEDIDEAMRLMDISRHSIDYHLEKYGLGGGSRVSGNVRGSKDNNGLSHVHRILGIVRNIALEFGEKDEQNVVNDVYQQEPKANDGAVQSDGGDSLSAKFSVIKVPMNLIREAVRQKGFTEDQLTETLRTYDQLNVWSVDNVEDKLKLFN